MDHKFSEIDHVTPLFNLFLVVHLPTHSDHRQSLLLIEVDYRRYRKIAKIPRTLSYLELENMSF